MPKPTFHWHFAAPILTDMPLTVSVVQVRLDLTMCYMLSPIVDSSSSRMVMFRLAAEHFR